MKAKVFLTLLGLLSGQPTYALSLDEAIMASLGYESQLKLHQIGVEQSSVAVEQSKKRYGLNVNLVSQYDFERIQTPKGVLFPTEGDRNGNSVQFQFEYPLYTSGRQKIGIDVAESQRSAQQYAYSSTKAHTILKTVMVYTDVLKKQALIHLKERVLANLKRNQYESNKKFKAGVITRADLAQVDAQVAQGYADLTQSKSDLMVSSAKFYQVTGIFPEQLQQIQDFPKIPDSFIELDRLIAQHPALQQAKYEQTTSENKYQLVQRELAPTVTLMSRLGRQEDANYINSESNNYQIGVQMNVPLYDSGLNKANLKKAKLDIEYARQNIETIQRNLSQEAQSTYSQLLSIRQNKDALKYAIQSATIALTYIQKELEFGTKTTFDLLTAEQKLMDVQTQQIMNNQDEIVLTYQILEQTGQLDQKYKNEFSK